MAAKARFPGPVPEEALRYWRGKGLRVGFSHKDVWLAEHAHGFTAAKIMRLDVLEDLRDSLGTATAEGKTFRTWSKEIEPALQKKGWWGEKRVTDPKTGRTQTIQVDARRLKTIYRSNVRAARAAGQWERIQRTKRRLPYLLYALGPSERHRPEHAAWAGTILPVDDPWWADHMPPNGWGCKCRVLQISAREAERRGGPSTRPERDPQPFVNDRTGEVREVDRGLDPAWASNPGRDRARTVRGALVEQVAAADRELARASARNVMRSPVLDGWLADPDGQLPAGVVSAAIQKDLDVTDALVRLDPEQLGRAVADRGAALYRALPDLIAAGTPTILDDGEMQFTRSGVEAVVRRVGETLFVRRLRSATSGTG